jgi:hypothetical protein
MSAPRWRSLQMKSILAVAMLALPALAARSQNVAPATPAPRPSDRTTLDVLGSLSDSDEDLSRGIAALRKADVASDVRQARARKDRRLIMMSGFAPFVPGLPFGAKAPSGYSKVLIRGTGDVVRSKLQLEFMALLRRYAEAYNKGILAAGDK